MLEPFPVAVRALDALHIASVEFLRGRGETVSLATFERRLLVVAEKLGLPLAEV